MDSCAKELSRHRRLPAVISIGHAALPDATDVRSLTELTELRHSLRRGGGPSAGNMRIYLGARIVPRCAAVRPAQTD